MRPTTTMRLTAISKVDRPPYYDVYWTLNDQGESVEDHRELAPVEAFYELTVEASGKQHTFEAEVRTTRDDLRQVDWDDDLRELLAEQGIPTSAWSRIGQAIFSTHIGESAQLPLKFEPE